MERYSIYTGEKVTEEMYLKTWELDNITFEPKDVITKKLALDWFYASKKSIQILWDNKENKLIGYIFPFLLKHTFATEYIINNTNYQKVIKPNVFCDIKPGESGDIYVFSAVIIPEFRDKTLNIKNEKSPFYNKKVIKILTEALVDWVYEIKKLGISINYVFSEKVSDDGEKYLKSLKMQPCFALEDDSKFAKLFTPDMFSKCSNYNKLYQIYNDENTCSKFDASILKDHNYLHIKDNVLHYRDLNLLDLAKKYKAPLEIAYTPMISERIKSLKELFANKIAKYGYGAKYNYAYATKANYYSEVVLTALKDVDMLETSSAYDIDIMVELAKQGRIKKGYTVICNGFKNPKYISSITYLLDKGINVIPVIENSKEFELLAQVDRPINVGLRYNSDFESRLIKNDFKTQDEFDNRFGFNEVGLNEMAAKIKSSKNLTLKLLHFHFGGTISSIPNYIKGFSNIFEKYCKLKKKYDSLEYFDFGGGFPIKYSLTYKFDYDKLVDSMIKAVNSMTKEHKIAPPELIGEHGRYTTADHSFYIYKIDFSKENYGKNWYIINGSLMNMTPDMWGIQQDFTILPVNLYENKFVPVCLGGETCDPDDRYFLNEENVKLFMPKIKEGQELYIAIFSIGAYQEIISGIGGLHHCLIPEGNELIILENKKGEREFYTPKAESNTKKMLDILDYSNKKFVKKF